jgi:hypothetical protein
VADCFKHRNKIGLDVALEALRDARSERKASADELWHHAKICRVAAGRCGILRPAALGQQQTPHTGLTTPPRPVASSRRISRARKLSA